MQTISLADILEKDSGDACSYNYCDTDGYSSLREWDYFSRDYADGVCELCGGDMRVATIVGEIMGAKARDGQFAALVESIREHGFQTPILMPGSVMNGHHRIAAAVALGITEIPYTGNGDEYYYAEEKSDWNEGSEDLGYTY